MIIGTFDLAVVGILEPINFLYWGKKIKQNIGCLIGGLLFGLVLPVISQKIEIDRVASEREVWDNFELLYTYFKYPLFWIIGGRQIAMLSNKKIESDGEN